LSKDGFQVKNEHTSYYPHIHVSPNSQVIEILDNINRGGLEILFSDQRTHKIEVPALDEQGSDVNVDFLVEYIRRHVMKDSREDLFVLNGTVRPGILILINDADWELEGEGKYKLQKGDHILFVSTLHGG